MAKQKVKEPKRFTPKRLYEINSKSRIFLNGREISYLDFYMSLGTGSAERLKTFYYLIDEKKIEIEKL